MADERTALRSAAGPLALVALVTAGCGMERGTTAESQTSKAAMSAHGLAVSPTWYRDVQPIVQSRCIGCHTAGGIAPFPLTSYADAFAQYQTIGAAVQTRRMPPWPPADGCQPLRDARRLEPAEVDTIVAWSIGGAEAGDPAEAPPAVSPPGGLTSVDARLDPGVDYLPQSNLAGHPHDDYHCFALDPGLTQDRDLVGLEILPGQPSLVHHVLLFTASPEAARAADDAEAGPGWTCFGGPGVSGLPATVGGWAPGSGATRSPEGTGIPIAAGSTLVMQVHYNLDHGPPAPDRSIVQLQYANGRVPRPARMLPIADVTFAIPPGATGYRTTVTFPFAQPATLWGLAPHMHTLGRHIRVEKDGGCLIDIPAWDFHWQQAYFLREPLLIPPGSRVTLACTWDNPTSRTVTWGEGTSDEMCLSYLYLTFP